MKTFAQVLRCTPTVWAWLACSACDIFGSAPSSVAGGRALHVVNDRGALVVTINAGDSTLQTLLDVAVPLSAMQSATVRRSTQELSFLDATTNAATWRLPGTVYALPVCPEGCATSSGTPILGIVGSDVFSDNHSALRISPEQQQLELFDDIAGDGWERAQLCEAVFPTPFRGGGQLLVEQVAIATESLRPVVAACVAPAPDAISGQRGADMLFVLSTGIDTSVISQAAWERLSQSIATPLPAPAEAATVWYGGVQFSGLLAELPISALVSQSAASRAPCEEIRAHARILAGRRIEVCGEDATCVAPSLVTFGTSEAPRVLVVPVTTPALQSLRTELRADSGEIDGILAADALRGVEIDLDYPNQRLLMRCKDGARCAVAPPLDQAELAASIDNATACSQRASKSTL